MKMKTQKQIALAKWVKYFEKVITPIIIVFLDFHLWNGIATINFVKWRNHLTKQIKEENDKMIWYKLVFVFLYISSLQRWQNNFFHQNLDLRTNLFGYYIDNEIQPQHSICKFTWSQIYGGPFWLSCSFAANHLINFANVQDL